MDHVRCIVFTILLGLAAAAPTPIDVGATVVSNVLTIPCGTVASGVILNNIQADNHVRIDGCSGVSIDVTVFQDAGFVIVPGDVGARAKIEIKDCDVALKFTGTLPHNHESFGVVWFHPSINIGDGAELHILGTTMSSRQSGGQTSGSFRPTVNFGQNVAFGPTFAVRIRDSTLRGHDIGYGHHYQVLFSPGVTGTDVTVEVVNSELRRGEYASWNGGISLYQAHFAGTFNLTMLDSRLYNIGLYIRVGTTVDNMIVNYFNVVALRALRFVASSDNFQVNKVAMHFDRCAFYPDDAYHSLHMLLLKKINPSDDPSFTLLVENSWWVDIGPETIYPLLKVTEEDAMSTTIIVRNFTYSKTNYKVWNILHLGLIDPRSSVLLEDIHVASRVVFGVQNSQGLTTTIRRCSGPWEGIAVATAGSLNIYDATLTVEDSVFTPAQSGEETNAFISLGVASYILRNVTASVPWTVATTGAVFGQITSASSPAVAPTVLIEDSTLAITASSVANTADVVFADLGAGTAAVTIIVVRSSIDVSVTGAVQPKRVALLKGTTLAPTLTLIDSNATITVAETAEPARVRAIALLPAASPLARRKPTLSLTGSQLRITAWAPTNCTVMSNTDADFVGSSYAYPITPVFQTSQGSTVRLRNCSVSDITDTAIDAAAEISFDNTTLDVQHTAIGADCTAVFHVFHHSYVTLADALVISFSNGSIVDIAFGGHWGICPSGGHREVFLARPLGTAAASINFPTGLAISDSTVNLDFDASYHGGLTAGPSSTAQPSFVKIDCPVEASPCIADTSGGVNVPVLNLTNVDLTAVNTYEAFMVSTVNHRNGAVLLSGSTVTMDTCTTALHRSKGGVYSETKLIDSVFKQSLTSTRGGSLKKGMSLFMHEEMSTANGNMIAALAEERPEYISLVDSRAEWEVDTMTQSIIDAQLKTSYKVEVTRSTVTVTAPTTNRPLMLGNDATWDATFTHSTVTYTGSLGGGVFTAAKGNLTFDNTTVTFNNIAEGVRLAPALSDSVGFKAVDSTFSMPVGPAGSNYVKLFTLLQSGTCELRFLGCTISVTDETTGTARSAVSAVHSHRPATSTRPAVIIFDRTTALVRSAVGATPPVAVVNVERANSPVEIIIDRSKLELYSTSTALSSIVGAYSALTSHTKFSLIIVRSELLLASNPARDVSKQRFVTLPRSVGSSSKVHVTMYSVGLLYAPGDTAYVPAAFTQPVGSTLTGPDIVMCIWAVSHRGAWVLPRSTVGVDFTGEIYRGCGYETLSGTFSQALTSTVSLARSGTATLLLTATRSGAPSRSVSLPVTTTGSMATTMTSTVAPSSTGTATLALSKTASTAQTSSVTQAFTPSVSVAPTSTLTATATLRLTPTLTVAMTRSTTAAATATPTGTASPQPTATPTSTSTAAIRLPPIRLALALAAGQPSSTFFQTFYIGRATGPTGAKPYATVRGVLTDPGAVLALAVTALSFSGTADASELELSTVQVTARVRVRIGSTIVQTALCPQFSPTCRVQVVASAGERAVMTVTRERYPAASDQVSFSEAKSIDAVATVAVSASGNVARRLRFEWSGGKATPPPFAAPSPSVVFAVRVVTPLGAAVDVGDFLAQTATVAVKCAALGISVSRSVEFRGGLAVARLPLLPQILPKTVGPFEATVTFACAACGEGLTTATVTVAVSLCSALPDVQLSLLRDVVASSAVAAASPTTVAPIPALSNVSAVSTVVGAAHGFPSTEDTAVVLAIPNALRSATAGVTPGATVSRLMCVGVSADGTVRAAQSTAVAVDVCRVRCPTSTLQSSAGALDTPGLRVAFMAVTPPLVDTLAFGAPGAVHVFRRDVSSDQAPPVRSVVDEAALVAAVMEARRLSKLSLGGSSAGLSAALGNVSSLSATMIAAEGKVAKDNTAHHVPGVALSSKLLYHAAPFSVGVSALKSRSFVWRDQSDGSVKVSWHGLSIAVRDSLGRLIPRRALRTQDGAHSAADVDADDLVQCFQTDATSSTFVAAAAAVSLSSVGSSSGSVVATVCVEAVKEEGLPALWVVHNITAVIPASAVSFDEPAPPQMTLTIAFSASVHSSYNAEPSADVSGSASLDVARSLLPWARQATRPLVSLSPSPKLCNTTSAPGRWCTVFHASSNTAGLRIIDAAGRTTCTSIDSDGGNEANCTRSTLNVFDNAAAYAVATSSSPSSNHRLSYTGRFEPVTSGALTALNTTAGTMHDVYVNASASSSSAAASISSETVTVRTLTVRGAAPRPTLESVSGCVDAYPTTGWCLLNATLELRGELLGRLVTKDGRIVLQHDPASMSPTAAAAALTSLNSSAGVDGLPNQRWWPAPQLAACSTVAIKGGTIESIATCEGFSGGASAVVSRAGVQPFTAAVSTLPPLKAGEAPPHRAQFAVPPNSSHIDQSSTARSDLQWVDAGSFTPSGADAAAPWAYASGRSVGFDGSIAGCPWLVSVDVGTGGSSSVNITAAIEGKVRDPSSWVQCGGHGQCAASPDARLWDSPAALPTQCKCSSSDVDGYWTTAAWANMTALLSEGRFIVTAECTVCQDWYRGSEVSTGCRTRCPGSNAPCMRNGNCSDGACACADGYAGPSCGITCPRDGLDGAICGGRGSCHPLTGHCVCKGNYTGAVCGTCAPGTCGEDCSLPLSLCTGCFVAGSECARTAECSPSTSTCVCRQGYYNAPLCNTACPGLTLNLTGSPCSGHGQCGHTEAKCKCSFGWGSADCSAECPGGAVNPCGGDSRGSCDVSGNAPVCRCLERFSGPRCEECAEPWVGAQCDVQCPVSGGAVCGGHGRCTARGTCICDASTADGFWAGTSCDACTRNYFGLTCLGQCTGDGCGVCSGHGTCDDGTAGSGTCHCLDVAAVGGAGTWTGAADCSRCTTSWFGVECNKRCPFDASGAVCGGHGVCADGTSGTGECSCSAGFTVTTDAVTHAKVCTACSPGHFGFQCGRCGVPPAAPSNFSMCSGHGQCSDGRLGAGVCSCSAGYGGVYCEVRCPVSHGVTCGGHGACLGDGTCACQSSWDATIGCSECVGGHFGPACTSCPPCSSHGTCDQGHAGSGACDCATTFGGALCTVQCPSDADGALCGGHGHCSAATGLCECFGNATHGYWTGSVCGACTEAYAGSEGSSCLVACPTGVPTGSSEASICASAGRCSNGTCGCDAQRCGSACEFGGSVCEAGGPNAALCPNRCSLRGYCDGGTAECYCKPDHADKDCSFTCAGGCGGHGVCSFDTKSCACTVGWWGHGCTSVCPGTIGQVPCSGAGLCTEDGQCRCVAGAGGPDCGLRCATGQDGEICGGNGVCDAATAQCRCIEGFGGDACDACIPGRSGAFCRDRCVGGRGTTVGFRCVCLEGFGGTGCAVACGTFDGAICGGHGQCSLATGHCECDHAWFGDGCGAFCLPSKCPSLMGVAPGGRWQCSAAGKCHCSSNSTVGFWGGAACDTCDDHHWGLTCQFACSCDRGSCRPRDGFCSCHADPERGFWAGTTCSVCAPKYVGLQCQNINGPVRDTLLAPPEVVRDVDVTGATAAVSVFDTTSGVRYHGVGSALYVTRPPSTAPIARSYFDGWTVAAVALNTTHAVAALVQPTEQGAEGGSVRLLAWSLFTPSLPTGRGMSAMSTTLFDDTIEGTRLSHADDSPLDGDEATKSPVDAAVIAGPDRRAVGAAAVPEGHVVISQSTTTVLETEAVVFVNGGNVLLRCVRNMTTVETVSREQGRGSTGGSSGSTASSSAPVSLRTTRTVTTTVDVTSYDVVSGATSTMALEVPAVTPGGQPRTFTSVSHASLVPGQDNTVMISGTAAGEWAVVLVKHEASSLSAGSVSQSPLVSVVSGGSANVIDAAAVRAVEAEFSVTCTSSLRCESHGAIGTVCVLSCGRYLVFATNATAAVIFTEVPVMGSGATDAACTAIASDYASGTVFIAVTPSVSTPTEASVVLTVSAATGRVSGVARRRSLGAVSERVLAVAAAAPVLTLTVSFGAELRIVTAAAFAVTHSQPPVVAAVRLNTSTVTVYGTLLEAFSRTAATPRCGFQIGGQVLYTDVVMSGSTGWCAVPDLPSADTCTPVPVLFGDTRVMVEGTVAALTVTAAAALESATNGDQKRYGPRAVAGYSDGAFGGTAVTLTAIGLNGLATTARCGLFTKTGQLVATMKALVGQATTTVATCFMPTATLRPTPPGAVLRYSHSGDDFGLSAVPFAVVGSPGGVTVTCPAVVIAGEKVSGVVAAIVDNKGNALGPTVAHGGVSIRAAFGDATCAVFRDEVRIAVADREPSMTAAVTKAGTAEITAVLLATYQAGDAYLVECVVKRWSHSAKFSVRPGPPATFAFQAGDGTASTTAPPASWHVTTTLTGATVVNPPLQLTAVDRYGNAVTDEAVLPAVIEAQWASHVAAAHGPFDRGLPGFVREEKYATGRPSGGVYSFTPALGVRGVHGHPYDVQIRALSGAEIAPFEFSLHSAGCSPGTEYAVSGTTRCDPCPAHGVCDGSTSVTAQPGFWRARETAVTIYDCSAPDGSGGCLGERECAAGYTGPRCGVCADGYGRGRGHQCGTCDSDVLGALAIAAALCAIAGATFWLSSRSISDGRLDLAAALAQHHRRNRRRRTSTASALPPALAGYGRSDASKDRNDDCSSGESSSESDGVEGTEPAQSAVGQPVRQARKKKSPVVLAVKLLLSYFQLVAAVSALMLDDMPDLFRDVIAAEGTAGSPVSPSFTFVSCLVAPDIVARIKVVSYGVAVIIVAATLLRVVISAIRHAGDEAPVDDLLDQHTLFQDSVRLNRSEVGLPRSAALGPASTSVFLTGVHSSDGDPTSPALSADPTCGHLFFSPGPSPGTSQPGTPSMRALKIPAVVTSPLLTLVPPPAEDPAPPLSEQTPPADTATDLMLESVGGLSVGNADAAGRGPDVLESTLPPPRLETAAPSPTGAMTRPGPAAPSSALLSFTDSDAPNGTESDGPPTLQKAVIAGPSRAQTVGGWVAPSPGTSSLSVSATTRRWASVRPFLSPLFIASPPASIAPLSSRGSVVSFASVGAAGLSHRSSIALPRPKVKPRAAAYLVGAVPAEAVPVEQVGPARAGGFTLWLQTTLSAGVARVTQFAVVAAVVAMYLVLPTAIRLAASATQCTTLDYGQGLHVRVLTADHGVSCDDPAVVPAVVWTLLAYAVGLPFGAVVVILGLGLLFSLNTSKVDWATGLGPEAMAAAHALVGRGSSAMRRTVGALRARALLYYLTGGYRTKRWWWEAVLQSRKAAVVTIVAVVSDARLRAYCVLWTLAGFLVLSAIARPFAHPVLSQLELVSMLSLVATAFGALLAPFAAATPGYQWLLTVCLLAVNASVIAAFLTAFAVFGVTFVPEAVRLRIANFLWRRRQAEARDDATAIQAALGQCRGAALDRALATVATPDEAEDRSGDVFSSNAIDKECSGGFRGATRSLATARVMLLLATNGSEGSWEKRRLVGLLRALYEAEWAALVASMEK